jgi:hypothetical protein
MSCCAAPKLNCHWHTDIALGSQGREVQHAQIFLSLLCLQRLSPGNGSHDNIDSSASVFTSLLAGDCLTNRKPVKSKSRLRYDRRSVGQSVMVSSPTWGPRPDLYYCQLRRDPTEKTASKSSSIVASITWVGSHGNVFSELLPRNGRLLWLCYPGFQQTS